MTKEDMATNGIAEITQLGATLISTISAGSSRKFREHAFPFRDGGHIKR